MGFYQPGEIKFLCDLARPHVGVVNNVYAVHLERAGSIENIARGKGELVEALPPAPEGVAVLNYDDPLVLAMRDPHPGAGHHLRPRPGGRCVGRQHRIGSGCAASTFTCTTATRPCMCACPCWAATRCTRRCARRRWA